MRERKQELEDVIERAMEFHGHLGPFLVIGVRMALIGMRELEV
ncbi:MAG: formylmethanofuran dehydrogenase, partial [Candidatus Bathyarchaeota archaeon]